MIDSIKTIALERGKRKTQPLYKQISSGLREAILNASLSAGCRLPPLKVMIDFWGVDYKTLIAALEPLEREGLIKLESGRGKGPIVLDGTRKRTSIALLRFIKDSLSLQVTKGVQNFCAENDILFDILSADPLQTDFSEVLQQTDANGILVFPLDTEEVRKGVEAVSLDRKIVQLDTHLEGLSASSVSIDHSGGAFAATSHLLEMHGLPVHLFGYKSRLLSSYQEREEGWSISMISHGHNQLDKYLCDVMGGADVTTLETSAHMKMQREVIRDFFEKASFDKISIFAVNDYVAKTVYDVAEEKGLAIGKDIFIVGFGDQPFADSFDVGLTTIAQCNERLGYEGVRMLLDSIKGISGGQMHLDLPASLIVRDSSVLAAEI